MTDIEKLVKLLDDFNRDLSPYAGEAKYTIWDDSVELAKYLIANDVKQVVHGRWEPVDHDGSWRVDRCSVCYKRMHYVNYDQPYPYCSNCGAKMDLNDVENK